MHADWGECPRCKDNGHVSTIDGVTQDSWVDDGHKHWCVLCRTTRVVLKEVAAAYRLGFFDAAVPYAGPLDSKRLQRIVSIRKARHPGDDHRPWMMVSSDKRFALWPHDERPGGERPDMFITQRDAAQWCEQPC